MKNPATNRLRYEKAKLGFTAGLVLAMGIVGFNARAADVLRGPIRGGFSVAEADRETGARKYALWGESATPLTADLWEVQAPRLELYGVGETTNLVFMPNRCLFDRHTKQITSGEPLRMWTGDGYLRMEGEGFTLDLEARRLWVSNRVEAVISKSLFKSERAGAPALGGAGTESAGADADTILIRSERLEYGDDRVEFLEAVRAEDAEGRLDCQRLALDLASSESRDVRALRAEGEVRFAATDIEVEAGRADYLPATEQLELEGDPKWVFRGRPGRAEKVVVDRARLSLSAVGGVQMELPAETFAMPAISGTMNARTRVMESDKAEPVRLVADRMDVQRQPGEIDRHEVVLRGGVTMEQGDGRLKCEELLVETKGNENAVSRAEATGDVLFEQGSDRMGCRRAEYDAAGAFAEFSGGVEWQTQARSGSAERVRVDLAENRYRAEGGVRMRFEQIDESWTGWLVPDGARESGDAAVAGDAVAEAQPTDIVCDRFEFRGGTAPTAVQSAEYEGNVSVTQGDRLHLTCNSLRAQLDAETNQVRSVVAEDKVELRAADAGGYRLARGDRAVYSAEEQEVILTGREGVEFFVIAPSGVSRGVGRQAIYRAATDSLILAGDPTITTPEGELTGSEVRLDRRENVLSATGPWQIRLPLGEFELPRLPSP